jgi:hypothetical protein
MYGSDYFTRCSVLLSQHSTMFKLFFDLKIDISMPNIPITMYHYTAAGRVRASPLHLRTIIYDWRVTYPMGSHLGVRLSFRDIMMYFSAPLFFVGRGRWIRLLLPPVNEGN